MRNNIRVFGMFLTLLVGTALLLPLLGHLFVAWNNYLDKVFSH